MINYIARTNPLIQREKPFILLKSVMHLPNTYTQTENSFFSVIYYTWCLLSSFVYVQKSPLNKTAQNWKYLILKHTFCGVVFRHKRKNINVQTVR